MTMCLHSTYSGVGRDSYLYIKKDPKSFHRESKGKRNDTPPLKPNPTYGAMGECEILLDVGTPKSHRRDGGLGFSRILLIPVYQSAIIKHIYTTHRGPPQSFYKVSSNGLKN